MDNTPALSERALANLERLGIPRDDPDVVATQGWQPPQAPEGPRLLSEQARANLIALFGPEQGQQAIDDSDAWTVRTWNQQHGLAALTPEQVKRYDASNAERQRRYRARLRAAKQAVQAPSAEGGARE